MPDQSSADPDFLERYPALREMQAVPLFGDLGFRFSGAGEGWAEIEFEASPKTHNLYGIVHGGVWLLLADSAMGGALATVAAPDERVITAQSEFRWLRPLEGDAIRVRGEVLRRGRTLSHATADLYDAAGKAIGRATGTYVILPPE
jgi:uncharacterized protein (TIGR00369 family)